MGGYGSDRVALLNQRRWAAQRSTKTAAGVAQRSLKQWLIDGGYHTLQLTLYGLVIGLSQ